MAMSDYSLSDIAAVSDGGGIGGGRNLDLLTLLILFAVFGGNWGGNRGYGNGSGGAGSVGGNELYPWMENQANIFNGLATLTQAVTSGFANAETAATSRQMADMQQMFGLSQQFAQCCCDNRLGLANLGADIAREACADRAAVSDGIRDVLENQNQNAQRILDKLSQDKLDEKNDEIAQLRTQVQMQNLAASQAAQNAFIQQGFTNEIDAMYQRLKDCPVPTMPVYGQTPIFTCNGNQGCGCGGF